jgi:hypothetical protein
VRGLRGVRIKTEISTRGGSRSGSSLGYGDGHLLRFGEQRDGGGAGSSLRGPKGERLLEAHTKWRVGAWWHGRRDDAIARARGGRLGSE